jgi:KaiC/GvpD/RAD55 family RecA-like ATPase
MCDSKKETTSILSRIVVGEVMSLSDLENLSTSIHDLGNVSIIVLDSLTGVLNLSGAPGSAGRQRELFHSLEVLRGLVNELGTHLMMTDHSTRNWSSGRPTPIGGNVLAHAVDSVVRVDRLDVGKNLVRVLVERSTKGHETQAVILVEGKDGLRTYR